MESIELLKSISNETKLRVVSLLLENELCVCELEEVLHIKQSNISRNLGRLKQANVVNVRREKQRGFYFLTDWFLTQENFVEHIRELRFKEPKLEQDYKEFLKHEEVKDENIYVCKQFSEVN
ncbi:MAG: metalloregulator ArsR/SmtB family transcription factor [Candidatus Izimaplasma sp.]|nr:metalloregulator ArsR/SmtB family transcription factor [Candidatus Izimaplasma bacterium]